MKGHVNGHKKKDSQEDYTPPQDPQEGCQWFGKDSN